MTTPPLHFVGVERACRFCHGTGGGNWENPACICHGTGVVTVARLADEREAQFELFAAEDEVTG